MGVTLTNESEGADSGVRKTNNTKQKLKENASNLNKV